MRHMIYFDNKSPTIIHLDAVDIMLKVEQYNNTSLTFGKQHWVDDTFIEIYVELTGTIICGIVLYNE